MAADERLLGVGGQIIIAVVNGLAVMAQRGDQFVGPPAESSVGQLPETRLEPFDEDGAGLDFVQQDLRPSNKQKKTST